MRTKSWKALHTTLVGRWQRSFRALRPTRVHGAGEADHRDGIEAPSSPFLLNIPTFLFTLFFGAVGRVNRFLVPPQEPRALSGGERGEGEEAGEQSQEAKPPVNRQVSRYPPGWSIARTLRSILGTSNASSSSVLAPRVLSKAILARISPTAWS